MPTLAFSGNDALVIDDRPLEDLGDGDAVLCEFPNDTMNVKTGKNGNTIYAQNKTGENLDVTLRVIRGSPDDKWLNGKLSQQRVSPTSFVPMSGEFAKQIGDGVGGVSQDTLILAGGVFLKNVGGKTNVEGDTEQSVAIYKMRFATAPRVIT